MKASAYVRVTGEARVRAGGVKKGGGAVRLAVYVMERHSREYLMPREREREREALYIHTYLHTYIYIYIYIYIYM
jgi:hypothetical protein